MVTEILLINLADVVRVVQAALVVPDDPVELAVQVALVVPDDPVELAVRAALVVPDDPVELAVQAALVVPDDPVALVVQAALVVPENPVELVVQAALVVPESPAVRGVLVVSENPAVPVALERELDQVEAVPRHRPAQLAVPLRTKWVTARPRRGRVPEPRVEDSAAAAETTREPVAAEAAKAWAAAE